MHVSVFPPKQARQARKEGGGKLKTTAASKNLMHVNDHVKGKLARIGGGSTLVPCFRGNTDDNVHIHVGCY